MSLANRVDLNDYPRGVDETDDRGRFRRAIADVQPGGVLTVPNGTYKADSLLVNKPISIEFEGDAWIESVDVNKDILTIQGVRESTTYSLLSAVNRGERVITLQTPPTDYQAGDMIVLTDETVRVGDGQTDVNTEVHEIAAINGAQITLRDFVRLPKKVSKVNVYKVHPLENVRITNFAYRLKEPSFTGRGLFLEYVRNVIIKGLRASRGAGSAIQIRKAMYVLVEKFQIRQPQVTGSGQGYGVQFYGGCNCIVIKDGYTVECRHAIDLEGTHDAVVSHVFDYNSKGAAFIMSHNGWTSDITFTHCHTHNSMGTGFVCDSQGFAHPLQCTFYHFNVIDCSAVISNRSNAGVYWYSPCKKSLVRGFQTRYISGEEGGDGLLGNAGIRCYPAKTDLLIDGCEISGFRRGIALQVAGSMVYDNDDSKITVRDTVIQNCDAAFLLNGGQSRRLRLYNISLKHIEAKIFEISGTQSQSEFVINGLSITHSPSAVFCTGSFTKSDANACRGTILDIQTDFPNHLSPPAQWNLSYTDLYFYGDGQTILLTGPNTTSGSAPLPDGMVEGQKVIFTTQTGTWTIHRGANMLLQGDTATCTLNAKQRAVSFIWKNGFWIQI